MILKEQRKLEMLDGLTNALSKEIEGTSVGQAEFGEWPIVEHILLDGKPFTFKKHEYLIEPYKDKHPFQVEIKATQLGLTSKALLRCMYGCRYGNYRGILYLFPSRSDVTDLSKTRLTPLIEDNPDTIGQWVKDTDAANVKKVWNTFLYLRGMRSRIGVKCHDDKTEVLTFNGWKLFKDVTMNDRLATRSPSGVFMWQEPIDIYNYEYSGEMLEFLANGLDFCVTPNHRLLLTSNEKKENEWFDIAEKAKTRSHVCVVRTCKKWIGFFPDFITTKGRSWDGLKKFITIKGNKINSAWESFGRHEDRKVNLKDFIAFLGIYIAEGCCSGIASGVREFGRVHISQETKSKHFKEIETLVYKISKNWKYSGHSFRTGDMGLADILFPLGNKYNKCFPEWVLNLPIKYLEILWEWALKGDGNISNCGHRTYATVSKKLADQFQELLQKCGRSASILVQKNYTKSFKDGREIKSTTPCYIVSERKSSCSIVPKPTKIQYNGNVYCASVPNGTLYTRRNGYALWSGNSIPVDFEVFDELDEAPQNAVDMALERMAHSEEGDLLFLSNPTLPDYGIDKLFSSTDMQYFLLKCPHCGEYTDMVGTFPDCLVQAKGKVIRACCKCGKELDPSLGEWVAKRPSITERRGRQYSQLYSQTRITSPEFILDKFRTTNNLTDFYNLKIGIAYVDAQNRLSVQEVLDCCGDNGMLSSSSDGSFMGVDQGGNLHVVIGKKGEKRKCDIIYLDVLKGNNNNDSKDDSGWKQLDELMNRFKVMRCVVDAQPNKRAARAFAERFPGRVFLCYYSEYQRGCYKWSEKDMTVYANRTESLDSSHKDITEQNVLLPRKSDMVQLFAEQMHNVAKKLETDDETGSQRYTYLRLGADHMRHSFNYFDMALTDSPELVFPELM